MKALIEKKAQTTADLKEHQMSRADAKESMAEATALREKDATACAKEEADSAVNIAALGKAITAVEAGMGVSFIQTPAAKPLENCCSRESRSSRYVPAGASCLPLRNSKRRICTRKQRDRWHSETDA